MVERRETPLIAFVRALARRQARIDAAEDKNAGKDGSPRSRTAEPVDERIIEEDLSEGK
ncbi:hypothetical protein [Sinorhizobium saheli]|uniref:hypothetical protein n=1 Tax=Sinorhizobium saheli TaxID=36856 RepID=UPI001295698E|nr:hypothetical protein [Sinorhizobium saheli]MQW88564.1 hypothetical protein [Sinorhizobium saheli]